MSEEIDRHVLRKYDILQKLGKVGPIDAQVLWPNLLMLTCVPVFVAGCLRDCLEGARQEKQAAGRFEEDIRRVPKCDRCTAHIS